MARMKYCWHSVISVIWLSHHEARPCCQWLECGHCPEPSCPAGKLGWFGWYQGGWPLESASLSPRTVLPAAPSNPHQHCTLWGVKISPLTHTNYSPNQGTLTRKSIPRMSTRFSTTLSLASRMDCQSVTSIWSMSKVSLCRPFTLSKRRSFLARFLIVA